MVQSALRPRAAISSFTTYQPTCRLVVVVVQPNPDYCPGKDEERVLFDFITSLGVETCLVDGCLKRQPQLLVDGQIMSLEEAVDYWPKGTLAEVHQADWTPGTEAKMLEDSLAAMTATLLKSLDEQAALLN